MAKIEVDDGNEECSVMDLVEIMKSYLVEYHLRPKPRATIDRFYREGRAKLLDIFGDRVKKAYENECALYEHRIRHLQSAILKLVAVIEDRGSNYPLYDEARVVAFAKSLLDENKTKGNNHGN